MCLGRRAAPPPPPPPPTPPPPRVSRQTSPEPAESTGTNRSAGENVENKRKGRKSMVIPLMSGSGTGSSGVQVYN